MQIIGIRFYQHNAYGCAGLHEIKYKLKFAKIGVDYVPDSFTLEVSNRQIIYWLVPDIYFVDNGRLLLVDWWNWWLFSN